MGKVVRTIGREGTKLVAGILVSAGAGAIAIGAAGLVPAAAMGFGKAFAGIGALGIGAWVADSAGDAVEKRVDTVWNYIDFLADGAIFKDPRVAEMKEILKALEKGDISADEAKERLDKLKAETENAETETAPETEE